MGYLHVQSVDLSRTRPKRSQRDELEATENKYHEVQGGGLEPRNTRVQVQRLNHLATHLQNVQDPFLSSLKRIDICLDSLS